MKVRLSNGDIRLRLSEFDVATVLEGRQVTATITDGFAVSLVPADDHASSVETMESLHVVRVPSAEVRSPSMADPTMYESPPGQEPHILVEMDRQV